MFNSVDTYFPIRFHLKGQPRGHAAMGQVSLEAAGQQYWAIKQHIGSYAPNNDSTTAEKPQISRI